MYPFPIIYNADSGLSLSQAADSGLYRVSWSGDATSLLVAFQMPTTHDGTTWDFSNRGGRITPDLEELENDLQRPPYGKFLEFVWSSVLKSNGATDQIGTLDPLTLAGLSETPICTGFDGQRHGYGSTYGDVSPDYFHSIADTYGYLRQYDFGSCSSFLPLRGFVRNGLRGARAPQTVAGKFPTGDIHLHTTKVHFLLASVLRDQTGSDTDVLRLPGDDELQGDLIASGHADTTVFGDHVSCPYSATWKVRVSLDVHAERPYYNRIQVHISDISGPDIDLDQCSGYAFVNSVLDLALTVFSGNFTSYQDIADGQVANQSGTVKARLVGQLEADVNSANEALAPPLPNQDLLVPNILLAAAAGAPAYRQEIQTQRATSTLLLSRAAGPAGSCINNSLQYLDNTYCSVATDATLRALQRQPTTANFGRALGRLVNSDRSMFTCGPIRGPGGYSGRLAALASTPNSTDASGHTIYLANRIGQCLHHGDVPRLFVLGGQIVQACVNPNASSSQCRRCAQKQDNDGPNCKFFSLLAANYQAGLFGRKCLRPVGYHSSLRGEAVYPQVFCRSAVGGRCVPRFGTYSGLLGSETAAMCVPLDPHCAPCWDLLDPGAAVHDPADRQACLDAPAYCRVPRGEVNPQSCDARDWALLFNQSLIRIPTPYRCRLALPLSRIDLQPDGYRVVLSQGFPCRSSGDCRPCPPGQACNVDALSGNEMKYLVWDQLTSVLGGGLGVPGDFDAPSCYPDRDELGHSARPATGTSALLGQLKNGKTLINPAGCTWQ